MDARGPELRLRRVRGMEVAGCSEQSRAAEPSPWVTERGRTNPGKGPLDKMVHASKGAPKMSGVVNVVNQQTPPGSTRQPGTSQAGGDVDYGT
jgi:hypothetical protein